MKCLKLIIYRYKGRFIICYSLGGGDNDWLMYNENDLELYGRSLWIY